MLHFMLLINGTAGLLHRGSIFLYLYIKVRMCNKAVYCEYKSLARRNVVKLYCACCRVETNTLTSILDQYTHVPDKNVQNVLNRSTRSRHRCTGTPQISRSTEAGRNLRTAPTRLQ